VLWLGNVAGCRHLHVAAFHCRRKCKITFQTKMELAVKTISREVQRLPKLLERRAMVEYSEDS
jgi:hypothetical protein